MYQLIRSDRKTIAIQVKPDGSLVVRAPRRASDAEIRAALERHRSWIARHQARAAAAAPAPEERLTEAELQKLKEKLIILLELRLRWFAPRVGVSYGSVSVRNQKSRWGSCSAQGNLSFNCLLSLVPMEVLDYVVVHELCHRKHMDHSPAFWAELGRVLPDYEARRRWLRENGPALMRRRDG